MGFFKLLHEFVKVALCIPRPLPNETKLKFAQDFKASWSFCFKLKVLNESNYSMPRLRWTFESKALTLLCTFFCNFHHITFFWAFDHNLKDPGADIYLSRKRSLFFLLKFHMIFILVPGHICLIHGKQAEPEVYILPGQEGGRRSSEAEHRAQCRILSVAFIEYGLTSLSLLVFHHHFYFIDGRKWQIILRKGVNCSMKYWNWCPQWHTNLRRSLCTREQCWKRSTAVQSVARQPLHIQRTQRILAWEDLNEGGVGCKEVILVHSSFVSLIQDRDRVRRLEGFSPLRAHTKTGRQVLR